MNAETRKALRPLVSTARAHLRDLQGDEVPHKLIPVHRSSARRLPAHLEKLLLEGIAEDGTLRGAIAERWASEGGSDATIGAFLDDPDSIVSGEEDRAVRAERDRLVARRAELEEDVGRLERALKEAKARNAAEHEAFDARLREQKAADKRARAGLEARSAAAEEALRKVDDERARLELEVDALRSELGEARRAAERVRLRSGRSTPKAASNRSSTRAAVPNDPVELAEWLDAGERMMRPYRKSAKAHGSSASESSELAIPDGISPDGAEAFDAIVEQGPRRVIVDGYNLAGALGHTPIHSSDARAAVLARASAIRRRSGAEVIVVFDAVGVEGRVGYVADSGVVVRFSKDRVADDDIVSIAHADPDRTVVISNDREVRERASSAGAIVLWSDAVVGAPNS